MRVALVYDRLNKLGGAEQVLIAFSEIFPQADWYTSVYDAGRTPFTKGWQVYSSWLSQIPWMRSHHEWFPWLMPFIFESFNLSSYDLVISIGSAESKGVITSPRTLHLNYCLTPTRYLYSHQGEYLSNHLYRKIAQYLRAWDQVASTRPDKMIAISTQVKNRIKKYYNRDAEIIFPPVDTQKFAPSGKLENWQTGKPDYYLTVSRLVPYKRIDKLIEVFNQNGKNLIVVGEGSDSQRLKKLAKNNIAFVGAVSDSDLISYYHHCRAFLHAGIEDFGIAMCEALASGKPVIARGAGGALDIVEDRVNGILVQSDSVEAWQTAIASCETMSFSPTTCRKSVARFGKDKWIKQMKERIDQLWQTNQK